METYYHINKSDTCDWKTGDEIDFEGKTNYYWNSLAEKGDLIQINGKTHSSDLIVRKALNCYLRKEMPPMEMKGYHFNPLRTLTESTDSLGNALRINREVIFESIRKESYPKLPSRKKSFWLMPNNDESLNFWNGILQGNKHKIFKVTINGKIHRSPQKWLIGGTFSINQWEDLAHKYWLGKDVGNYDDEILLEGSLKIVEEITV